MLEEVWKDIPGYVGYYQVSNLGRVRSLSRIVARKTGSLFINGKLLKQYNTNKGRLEVHLCRNGKWVHWLVHRIVATTFLPNPHNLPQINHLNGDPRDNRLDNLEWCDQSRNELHKIHELGHTNNSLLSSPRKVMLVEQNIVFASLGEASRKSGVPLHTLFSRLQSGKSDPNGNHWEYVI